MAYSETSGGIRTYIDQKRKYILQNTDHEHVLIVPGRADAVERNGRLETHTIESPPSGHGTYRLLWRPDEVAAALDVAKPDVIELGTFFVCPWPAFQYRKQRRAGGDRCVVAGYFHTDIAEAYVQTPVEQWVSERFHGWHDAVASLGGSVADLLGLGAERYFGSLFERCDAMFAAAPDQAQRLREYGIEKSEIVPLGVDIELFSPSKRSRFVRERFEASEDTCLLAYVGRMDAEKHIWTVVDAYTALRDRGFDARLVMIGDGPLVEELHSRAETTPDLTPHGYCADPGDLAELLASADVYVTAGPHETFGLSVIEAQAAGLPIVGVAAGALPQRVIDGTGLLGPVDDAEEMADNIVRAWERRESLSSASRRHVVDNFSWNRSFERLLEIYRHLLGSPTTL